MTPTSKNIVVSTVEQIKQRVASFCNRNYLTTMRQQLLWSHLRVASIAAVLLAFAAFAIYSLTQPMSAMQRVNMPRAHAAMLVQLGLQRSNAALHGWVALKEENLLEDFSRSWNREILPAQATLVALSEKSSELTTNRDEVLESLDKKLFRLRKLQQWIADVAVKPGNEPARLVFYDELTPLTNKLSIDFQRAISETIGAAVFIESAYMVEFQLALAQASAAIGRFVVEAKEEDITTYSQSISIAVAHLDTMIDALPEDKLIFSQVLWDGLRESISVYQRLVDSIIASRRSPRSNVAWHTISSKAQPLSNDISALLESLAEEEVLEMRTRAEQTATWTIALAVSAFIASIVLAAIAVWLSHGEARRIAAPISRLSRAIEQMGQGEFRESLPTEGVDEIKGLIRGFNSMQISIAQSHDALSRMAFTDELTKLANRKDFQSSIETLLLKPRQEGCYVGFMVLDLDHFKLVNDTLGHDVGDFLLKTFASRLNQCLRPGDRAYRLGGDEFAVILESLNLPTDAEEVASRIIQSVSVPLIHCGHRIVPSTTIGIAACLIEDLDHKSLLKKADLALYAAKEKQRGGYHFFSEKLNKKTERRSELIRIIENHEISEVFHVVYQPYINLETERIIGFEALLRWHHPDYSDVYPDEFIRILENSGHMLKVSRWVLNQAADQLAKLNAIYSNDNLSVSVNISAALLREEMFTEMIQATLNRSGIAAFQLILEVTETTIMTNLTHSLKTMVNLEKKGVRFAMDDFGTGYSSLSRLKAMPLDFLKIDRSFVAGMHKNKDDYAIVEAIIRLARALGLNVTAEGIEEIEHAKRLKELGCDVGQGFLFAKPMQAKEFEELLKNNRMNVKSIQAFGRWGSSKNRIA